MKTINDFQNKSKRQSMATDAVQLSTSKIITLTISMVTTMLLSRFRTLEEYGTYSQILLVINLTSTIFMFGLPNSINFFLARADSQEEREKFLSSYYTLSTLLSFFIGLTLVISTPFIVRYFDNTLIKNFVYVFAVFPWAKIILSSIDNVLIVYGKTNYLMIFHVLNSIFLLLIILIVEAFNWGFGIYMFFFIIIEALFALSVYILVRHIAGRIIIYLDKELIKTILKFSLPIGIATIVGTLKKELDKLVIAGFFDTELLAIYSNAAREMPVVFVATSITAVLMPQITILLQNNEKHKAINIWGDATIFSYTIICFLATGFFVYAPEIMSLLYSEKYIYGAPVFRIYSLVLLFRSTYFGMVLNSIGKTKIILHSSILSLLSNIILNFVFYYMFGFIGPSIATLIATSVSAFYQLWITSKYTNINFSHILPWREIIFITLKNFVFGIIFLLVKRLISLEVELGEVVEAVILGLVWGGLYLLLSYRLLRDKWHALNNPY